MSLRINLIVFTARVIQTIAGVWVSVSFSDLLIKRGLFILVSASLILHPLFLIRVVNVDLELFVDLQEHLFKSCDGNTITHYAEVFEIQIELTEESPEIFSYFSTDLESNLRGDLGEKFDLTEVALEVRLDHSICLFIVLDHGDLVARAETFLQEKRSAQAHHLSLSHDANSVT